MFHNCICRNKNTKHLSSTTTASTRYQAESFERLTGFFTVEIYFSGVNTVGIWQRSRRSVRAMQFCSHLDEVVHPTWHCLVPVGDRAVQGQLGAQGTLHEIDHLQNDFCTYTTVVSITVSNASSRVWTVENHTPHHDDLLIVELTWFAAFWAFPSATRVLDIPVAPGCPLTYTEQSAVKAMTTSRTAEVFDIFHTVKQLFHKRPEWYKIIMRKRHRRWTKMNWSLMGPVAAVFAAVTFMGKLELEVRECQS